MTERKILLDVRRAERKACAWALVAFQASCPSAKTRSAGYMTSSEILFPSKGDSMNRLIEKIMFTFRFGYRWKKLLCKDICVFCKYYDDCRSDCDCF